MSSFSARALRGMVKMFGSLPLGFHYAVGDFLSWFAKNIMKYRADVVMVNLSRAFPQMKYKDLKKIYDRFYRHLGEIIAETIWYGASDYKRLDKARIVTVENPDILNLALASSPSVTMLYSHLGNWEIIGGVCSYKTDDGRLMNISEESVRVVYKKLSSKVSDEFFALNRIAPLEREGTSTEVETSNILRYVLKHKDEKMLYIYIADQYPYYGSSPYDVGMFLNQPTKGMLGSLAAAHKLGHAVVYMNMRREERGHYRLIFTQLCEDASKIEPGVLIRKYFDLLEKDICECPENWLWSHKRWK